MSKFILESFKPRDHAEAVALFRAEIIGALARRDLGHGELHAALVKLASHRYRPPGAENARRFGVSTIERWYYAYRNGGLEALMREPRSDRGPCRALSPELRQLLCVLDSFDDRANAPDAAR